MAGGRAGARGLARRRKPLLPPSWPQDHKHALMEAIDAEERQLEVAGPMWRPPTTAEVLRGLPFFRRLPELAMNTMLRGKVRLRSYRASSAVRPKGERWALERLAARSLAHCWQRRAGRLLLACRAGGAGAAWGKGWCRGEGALHYTARAHLHPSRLCSQAAPLRSPTSPQPPPTAPVARRRLCGGGQRHRSRRPPGQLERPAAPRPRLARRRRGQRAQLPWHWRCAAAPALLPCRQPALRAERPAPARQLRRWRHVPA
jgi:hypothetical protein